MNVKRTVFIALIIVSSLLPFIAIGHAQNVPKYVGIHKGDTYIWKTKFDDGPLADFYEDNGLTEELAELEAEEYFDDKGWSTKTEGWKVYIVDLYPEREEDWDEEGKPERVKFVYNWYKTKDADDPDAWKKIEKYGTRKIYETDEEIYESWVSLIEGFGEELFLPKKLHFEDIVEEIEEEIEDDNEDDKNDADISSVKIQYFFQKKIVGISTEWNFKGTSEMESFESICKYTDDGILYYYEWTYDGDIIEKLELETIGGIYLIENFWWIAIIAGAVIIGLIIVVIVIIVKRKR